jgi:hypothetical protein
MWSRSWLDSVSEEDAEAIVYAGGIMDLDELAEADPNELLEEIVNSVDLGHVRVPENYTFNIEMVKKWVALRILSVRSRECRSQ